MKNKRAILLMGVLFIIVFAVIVSACAKAPDSNPASISISYKGIRNPVTLEWEKGEFQKICLQEGNTLEIALHIEAYLADLKSIEDRIVVFVVAGEKDGKVGLQHSSSDIIYYSPGEDVKADVPFTLGKAKLSVPNVPVIHVRNMEIGGDAPFCFSLPVVPEWEQALFVWK
jgi:hypothetical protein